MANQPKNMYQIRQILEHLSRGTSIKRIAGLMGMSRNTVKDYRDKFLLTGTTFHQLLEHSDVELSHLIKTKVPVGISETEERRMRELASLLPHYRTELGKTGVTKLILWNEYLKDFPDGYRYTRFCHFLSTHQRLGDAVMRQVHLPGEELQIDFAGDRLHYIDRETAEVISCEILVSTMPYSHFTHAVAVRSQKQPDLIEGLVQAMNYLGAVPHLIKCDNMKSAVARVDRYTPEFTDAMEYFAQYYGTTVVTARVRKPRDKASVESAVRICYLRIYAPLRHRTFYSLNELNHAIARQLEIHNDQVLQGREYSRRQRYTQEEFGQMKALPPQEYQFKKSTWSKVGKGYHVILGEDRHSYSVPFGLIGKRLKLIYTSDYVEIYNGSNRVAIHQRSYRQYGNTTLKEHMPSHHQHMLETRGYDGTDFMQEAQSVGPYAVEAVKKMIHKAHYVQHTYPLWQAFKRMKKTYGHERLEAACARLSTLHQVTCSALANVLKNRLDLEQTPEQAYIPPILHDNIRGPQAYNNVP